MKHKSCSNKKTFLILVVSSDRAAFASKPPKFRKQSGMLWAVSWNINRCTRDVCAHSALRQHVTFLDIYKQGEEAETIYGCFRGLSNTPLASFLSLFFHSLFFLACTSLSLLVLHPLLNRKLFPSMQSVIHAPASETLPACFVCWTDGNRPNKVPRSPSSWGCCLRQPLSFDRKTAGY